MAIYVCDDDRAVPGIKVSLVNTAKLDMENPRVAYNRGA
jgi:hypothetical protein